MSSPQDLQASTDRVMAGRESGGHELDGKEAGARWLTAVRPMLGSERAARAAWTRVAEPGDPVAESLVAERGAVEALAALARPSTTHEQVLRDRAIDVDFSGLQRSATVLGLRLVIPSDPDWPCGVDDLDVPPIALWVKGPGCLSGLRERSVAVVGARAATAYGIGQSHEISAVLADRGYTVVSGAAYGIDREAHTGALAVGGQTLAVLAGGLDRHYPPGNARLIAQIAELGALISEVAPGGAPTKPRFLQRNRLMATMTSGTLVVEANLRSGSLNTARTAQRHLRPVAAVPGPVVSPSSAGCHVLIRENAATLVTDAAEMIELVGRLGVDAAPRQSAPPRPEDALDPRDRDVLAVVPYRQPVGVAELASAAALPVPATLAALARLELSGLVVRAGQTWRKPGRPTRAGPGS